MRRLPIIFASLLLAIGLGLTAVRAQISPVMVGPSPWRGPLSGTSPSGGASNCISPCAVTIASTTAGSLLIVGTAGSATNAVSAITAAVCNNSWVLNNSNVETDSASVWTAINYCTSTVGSKTSLTITTTSGNIYADVWEFLRYNGATSGTVDKSGSASNSVSGGNLTGIALANTGQGELLVQTSQDCALSAITSPYILHNTGIDAFDWAFVTNTSYATAPTWTISSGSPCGVIGISFK